MQTPLKLASKSCLALLLVSAAPAMTNADSLWSAQFSSLVSDKKASAIGDIVTVVVQESNTTTKDSETSTSKKTALDASISSFLYPASASKLLTKGGSLPAINMSSANSFDGSGKINNSESIVAQFGVRVVDVLPNKNMVVEGIRQTSFAGESRTVILRGTIRPYDISPANSVFSYNLADVSIKFTDSGAAASAQQKGWFSKIWDAVSPF